MKDGDGDSVDDCSTPIAECMKDNKAPVTTMTVRPIYVNLAGSTFNFTVSDNPLSSSNTTSYYCVSDTTCCPDNAIEHDGNFAITLPSEGELGVEGTRKLHYYSEDKYNNVEKVNVVDIFVDTLAPSIQGFSYAVEDYSVTSDRSRVDIQLTIDDTQDHTFCEFRLEHGPESVSLYRSMYVTKDANNIELSFTNPGINPGIADGTYLFTAHCLDTAQNPVSLSQTIHVNKINDILWISPNVTMNHTSFTFQLKATDTYDYCVAKRDLTCPIDRDAQISVLIDGYNYKSSGVIGSSGNLTYNCKIDCYKDNSISATSNALFTIDTQPPQTQLARSLSGGIFGEFNPESLYAPFSMNLICDDPGIDVNGRELSYPPVGKFGCNSTHACVSTADCNVQTCDDYSLASEVSFSGSGSYCLCYYSVDKGYNQEIADCVSVQITSDDPRIWFISPYNMFVTRNPYTTVEYGWDQATGNSKIYLTWRNENLESSTNNVTVDIGSGTGQLQVTDLSPGRNILELMIVDSTYDPFGSSGLNSQTIDVYYDTYGPNFTSAIITNSINKRIDNDSGSGEVAGFNTNIGFKVNVNDFFYMDPLNNKQNDISLVKIYVDGREFPMNRTQNNDYVFTYDPALYGYLYSGPHTVEYVAEDAAFSYTDAKNSKNYSQLFTVNETTVFSVTIYSNGKRIDTGGIAEMGNSIVMNGTVSNPAYIKRANVKVTCTSDCQKSYTESFTMDSVGAVFSKTISPNEMSEGSYNMGPGQYTVTFTFINVDDEIETFTSQFTIQDTTIPTVTIELQSPHVNADGVPIITRSKTGQVEYYDVIVTGSEPINVTKIIFKVNGKEFQLTTFGVPIELEDNKFKYKIAIDLTDPVFDNIDVTDAQFVVEVTDLAGNKQTAVTTGGTFAIDNFGGNPPILDPDIPPFTTSNQLSIQGKTSPAESNVDITSDLKGMGYTSTTKTTSGTEGQFSTSMVLPRVGGYEINVTPKDYLGNVGGTTTKTTRYDSSALVLEYTEPQDGEVLRTVTEVRIRVRDYDSGVDTSSLSIEVDGETVNPVITMPEVDTAELRYMRNFAEGAHTVKISGKNNAGLSSNHEFTFTINNNVPTEPEFSIDGATWEAAHGKWYLNAKDGFPYHLKFFAPDSNIEVSEVMIEDKNDASVTVTGSGYNFDGVVSGTFGEGIYTVIVKASSERDGARGAKGIYKFKFEVDTTPPIVSPDVETIYTNSPSFEVTGSYDGLDPDDYIEITGDVTSPSQVILDNTLHSFKGQGSLSSTEAGTYSIILTGYDKAGNSFSQQIPVILDTTATKPIITRIYSTQGGNNLVATNASYYVTNVGQDNFGVTVEGKADAGTVQIYKSHETKIGRSSEYLENTVDSDGTFTATLSLGQGNGENYIRILSTDLAGNNNELSITIFSDTSGADVSMISIEKSSIPRIDIGSTRSDSIPNTLGTASPVDCSSYTLGTLARDACQINKRMQGDTEACAIIANSYFRISCCEISGTC
jgi:hypothetical protein